MDSTKVVLGAILALLLGSCTSSVNGKFQDVKITSNVPNTRIYINGKDCGTTPNYVTLQRTDKYYLELKAPGYYPYRRYVTGEIDPIFYTGILGGGVPMIIDAVKGTHKEFEPIDAVMPTSEMPIIGIEPASSNEAEAGSNFGSQLAGIIVSSLVTAATNEFIGSPTLSAPASPSNSTGGGSISVHTPQKTCTYCNGTGKVSEKGTNYGYGAGYYQKQCPSCLGKGYRPGFTEFR